MPCIAGNIQIAICQGYYIGTSLWAWLAGKLVNLSTDLWRRVYSLAAADHDPCHPSYADFSHTKTELAALGVLIHNLNVQHNQCHKNMEKLFLVGIFTTLFIFVKVNTCLLKCYYLGDEHDGIEIVALFSSNLASST